MLRASHLPRPQSAALNCLLVNKRWQKTTPGSTTAPKTASSSSPNYPTATTAGAGATATDRTTKPTKSGTTAYSPIVPPSARTGPPPIYPRPPTYSGSSSSGRKGSSGGKIVKAVVYGVALGLTATIVYAEYENGPFRRQLESTIPYSSDLFNSIDQFLDPVLGRQRPSTTGVTEKLPDLAFHKDKEPITKKITDEVKNVAQQVTNKLPDKTTVQKAGEQVKDAVSHARDKLPDTKKVKDTVDHVADQVKGVATSVREALPDSQSIKKNLTHAKEQVEDAAHHVKDAAHQAKEKVKDALPVGQSGDSSGKIGDTIFRDEAGETGLPPPIPQDKYKQLEEEIRHLFEPLSKQMDDAVQSAKDHIAHMKTLMDSSHVPNTEHETWKRAEHLQEQAKHTYEQVTDKFAEWKKKLIEYTTHSDGKVHPDEKKLDEKYQELQKHYTTSNFVRNFRSYIDEATRSFQREIETMFPSLAGKQPSQLTPEDLQALLVHAHRRVVKLQNDIARMRINESDSVKAAMDIERANFDRLVEERVQQRVQRTTEQLTEELKIYEKNLRQQFDEHLKNEIVLQHQALTQYLADVLSRQYKEWAHEYEKQLETESIKIHLNLQNQLRGTLNRLNAIEQAIEANYDSQQRARQAQQLWIQAQNLLSQIVHGTATEQDLEVVSKIVPDEKFVQVLLNELKTDDLSSTNEQILRDRFQHVKTLCQRFALVDDQHNSLWHYFLSYLQSLLIVRQRDDSILLDDAIDLNQLNTFTILNYVQSYLEHNQWYNALRLMQLLTGEPRNVAQSWINDTRSYLAKKQTSELLEAYANSIGLGTLPRTS